MDIRKKAMLTEGISLLGIAAIPQLLFFWLAPGAPCLIAVYCFGTALTAVHFVLACVLAGKLGARRAAAPILTGTAVWLCLLACGGVLLVRGAAVRSAVFCLATLCTVYLALVSQLLQYLLAHSAAAPVSPAGPETAAAAPALAQAACTVTAGQAGGSLLARSGSVPAADVRRAAPPLPGAR
jgi:hypothetical protein